jgi:hypothetical protein
MSIELPSEFSEAQNEELQNLLGNFVTKNFPTEAFLNLEVKIEFITQERSIRSITYGCVDMPGAISARCGYDRKWARIT